MWIALIAWGVLNIIGFILIQLWITDYDAWDCIFIYPMLDQWMHYRGYKKFSRIVIRVLFTIVLLPCLLWHFGILIFIAIVAFVVCGILDLGGRLFKKNKR